MAKSSHYSFLKKNSLPTGWWLLLYTMRSPLFYSVIKCLRNGTTALYCNLVWMTIQNKRNSQAERPPTEDQENVHKHATSGGRSGKGHKHENFSSGVRLYGLQERVSEICEAI